VRSESIRSRCKESACSFRFFSASSALFPGCANGFGIAAALCCSSTDLLSQPFDMSRFYAISLEIVVRLIKPDNKALFDRPRAATFALRASL
jgi:hypothetical protein